MQKKGKFWISDISFNWKVKKWIWNSTKKPLEKQPKIPYKERKHRYCMYGSYDGKKIRWFHRRCRKLGKWKANYYVCQSYLKGFKSRTKSKSKAKQKKTKATKKGK